MDNIQPDHWLAEYTTELINVLNVLAWLVDLEPTQAELLEKICSGTTISVDDLRAGGVFQAPVVRTHNDKKADEPDILSEIV